MWGRRVGATLLLAAASCSGRSSLSDETDLPPALFIRNVVALSYDCSAEADPDALIQLGGVLDLSLSQRYGAVLLVGNTLTGVESSVALDAAEIVLRTASGEVLASSVSPTTGFVDGTSGGEVSWGLCAVEMIAPTSATDLLSRLPIDPVTGVPDPTSTLTVVAEVVARGATLVGEPVASPRFTYTIDVCYRCLIEFPLEADDPAVSGYQCTNTEQSPESVPCRVGQDNLVDCRLCSAAHSFCVCSTC